MGRNGNIGGFSQTHVSGTGGGAKYGNVLQPTVGAPMANGYDSPRSEERAEIGLYSVDLARYGIKVEVTAARRTALYRFTFSGFGPEQHSARRWALSSVGTRGR